jgi:selenocysteine lyase/cysteine desulfurase
MSDSYPITIFDRFRAALAGDDPLCVLREGLIGKSSVVDGPFGPKPILYCDYTASGRALRQLEDIILEDVLPFYANSHTEASYCGARMTAMRRSARQVVAHACGAGPDHAVIFSGSGATAGLNRLVHLLGVSRAVSRGEDPLVLIGPYEHHSNILPWRESGACVQRLPEGANGGPDLSALKAALDAAKGRLVVGAFSAASNVTGKRTNVAEVTRLLRDAGARSVWDYAACGPYVPIEMTPAEGAEIDAIVLSPHKFVGGPASSGVLVVRRDAVTEERPSLPGGGTVSFVSPDEHDYLDSLEAREEAGTPNVVGDIRTALAFVVKEVAGLDRIAERGAVLRDRALAAFAKEPRLEILGDPGADSLPILSFRVHDGAGGLVHHQFVTRLLSDLHGVQVRGGCACAGPYVHDLLGIDKAASDRMRDAIAAGNELEKPGFVRMNLSYLLTDAEAQRAIDAVLDVAARAIEFLDMYEVDPARAIFGPERVVAA